MRDYQPEKEPSSGISCNMLTAAEDLRLAAVTMEAIITS
jgi:hypothetical protein